jgi:hypothetical protein
MFSMCLMKKITCYLLFFYCVTVYPIRSSAQDSVKAVRNWTFLLEPYVLFPNMNGTVGIGNINDAVVDASPGDIFNKLNMAAMLYFEAGNDKWNLNTDFIYMDLKQQVKEGKIISSGEASAKQFAWELTGLRRVEPWLEVGVGTLLNSVEAGVNINTNNIGGGTTNRSGKRSQAWLDPMLIVRTQNGPGEKFVYSVRGEVGGFGIGSDFCWQLQAYAGYRFSKMFQLTAGYRIIGIDYTNGSGADRFLYDVNTFGPVIRFGFNF